MLKIDTLCLVLVSATCLVGAGCRPKVADQESPPLRIVATDAGFEAPHAIAAGLRHIVFENHGSVVHECMLVKLPPGMSPEDYVAAVKQGSLFPAGGLDYSGVGLTSPGGTAEMWLRVDPGQYILICWNNGHATSTPVHPFTVEAAGANDDRVPKEDVVLKLVDYRFELSGDLHPGTQIIRVETTGPSMHEVDIFRLHDGKTADDVKNWQKHPGEIPAPAEACGGALDSHDIHRVVWMRKDFTPGRYVLHCEMPVADSKLTHADVGMVREIEIGK